MAETRLKSEDEIREQYDKALEGYSHDRNRYDLGVTQALGWVLGEYSEPPIEDE